MITLHISESTAVELLEVIRKKLEKKKEERDRLAGYLEELKRAIAESEAKHGE